MNESFRRECCDRCGEWNDQSDVSIIECIDGSGEVVCHPCLNDEQGMENEKDSLFDCYGDELA